jgi:hypothetical protein
MKAKVFLTAVAVLAATSVLAGTLNVVSSFMSQKTWRKGLDYEAGYIYTTSNYSDNNIHKYTTAGSLVGSIPSPASSMDLKWDGSYIWLCTFSPAYVYRLTSTGSVVTSFSGPASGYGLAWTGTYLYYSSTSGNMIWRMTTTGSVVTSFSSGCSFVGGLDYDGTNLWVADWPSSGGGLKYMTTNGSLLDSFTTPGAARPSGVCWDGTYVWYHQYSTEPAPCFRAEVSFSGVAPTSMGKIKAVFR